MTLHFKTCPLLAAESNAPQSLLPWLHHHGSLTDKLKLAQGSVNLVVLSQQWVLPTWWDVFFLKIIGNHVFQREILMTSQNKDYWYARTVIPESCYRKGEEYFGRLADESIRNLIFNGDSVHLVNRMTYAVDVNCLEYFWVKKHLNLSAQQLWVRLTEYSYLNIDSFYVVEILLPELEKVCG